MGPVKRVREKYLKALASAVGAEKVEEAMHDKGFRGRLNYLCHEEAAGRKQEPSVVAGALAMSVFAACGYLDPM